MNLLIKTSFLLVSTFLFSQAATAQSSPYDGLYMGVEGSYAKTKHNATKVIEPKFEGVYLESDVLSTNYRNSKYNNEGAGAGFFVGYRLSEGVFTVATEASYGYSFISNKVNAIDTFEMTNEFGAAFMPGFWVQDNIVIFGQVGVSQLKLNALEGTTRFNSSDSGFIFGGGFQVYASNNISLRASYTRSTHSHKTTDSINIYEFVGGILEQTGVAEFEYESTIKRDKYALSLIYNF